MAITRKPKTADTSASPLDIEALIAKGGSVAHTLTNGSEEKPTTAFTLRVPTEILATLNEHIKKQPYKVPRQQWILEAVMQRLERELLTSFKEKSP